MYRSKKIFLRPFNENDIDSILEMRMDLAGVKAAGGLPYPSNEFSIRNWITNLYPKDNLTTISLVIAESESNQFIGYCSALNISYLNRNAHIGFFLHKNGRGKGYFKEAQILFYGYLFNELNMRKVYSHFLAYNEIAIKAVKQIGFKEDGIMKEHIFQGGKYHDTVLLSLTEVDFHSIHNLSSYLV
jgi:RimJ/RimL family protein N-acetyltransferase